MTRGPEQPRIVKKGQDKRRRRRNLRLPAVAMATLLAGSGCTISGIEKDEIQAKPGIASPSSHTLQDCFTGNAPVEEVDYCVAFTAIDTARNATGQVEKAFKTSQIAINEISTPEIKKRAADTLVFAQGGKAIRMAIHDEDYKGAEKLADGIESSEIRSSAKNIIDEVEVLLAANDMKDGVLDKEEEKILYEIEDQALLLKVVGYLTSIVERDYNFATYYITDAEKNKTNAAIDATYQEFEDTVRSDLALWNTVEYKVETEEEGYSLYNEWSRRRLNRTGPDAKPEFPLQEKTQLTDSEQIVQQFAGFVTTMKGIFHDPSDSTDNVDVTFWRTLDVLASKPDLLNSHFFVTATTSENEKTGTLEAWEYTYTLNIQPITEETRQNPDIQVTIKQKPSGPEALSAKAFIDSHGHFHSAQTKGAITQQQARDALSIIDTTVPNITTNSTNTAEVLSGGTDYPYEANLRRVTIGSDGEINVSFGNEGPFSAESEIIPPGNGPNITSPECFDIFTAIDAIEGSEYDLAVTLEIADRLLPGNEEPLKTTAHKAIDATLASTATVNLDEGDISALEAEQLIASMYGSKDSASAALDIKIAEIAMNNLSEHNLAYALHVTELIKNKKLRTEVAKKISDAKKVLTSRNPDKIEKAEQSWKQIAANYGNRADSARTDITSTAADSNKKLDLICAGS